MTNITFFTVCGGGEEYEFLLGSIEHHARLGSHLVLDVSPSPRPFRGLPDSVRWVRAPFYGSGSWATFRLATVLERARQLALDAFPAAEFMVHLDSDEYFNVEAVRPHLVRQDSAEIPRAFLFDTVHWRDSRALRFGAGEVHMRAWDVRTGVEIRRNPGWPASPHYNGNPDHHPLAITTRKTALVKVRTPSHFHLHYALGAKRADDETARTTIDGWPNGVPVEDPCPWPEPLRRWAETGELPSSRFSA